MAVLLILPRSASIDWHGLCSPSFLHCSSPDMFFKQTHMLIKGGLDVLLQYAATPCAATHGYILSNRLKSQSRDEQMHRRHNVAAG